MKKIYLDYAATTPLDEEVFKEISPYFTELFGNASTSYSYGRDAAYAVDEARRAIAKTFGCKSDEIYFTSGGSESDNWAIKGFCLANKGERNEILVGATEHPAVLNAAKSLSKFGFVVKTIPVDSNGLIIADEYEKMLGNKTLFVSIMTVNNETGATNDIARLCKAAHDKGAVFHTDAVQAIGHADVRVDATKVDMLSISAHKFYGPKGVGVLYIKKGVKIDNLIDGGHQELSRRAGTTNTPAIVGMAKALDKVIDTARVEEGRLFALKSRFVSSLLTKADGIAFNGGKSSIASIISVTIDGVSASALVNLADVKGLCISAGSACAAGSVEPSHVLKAMGFDDERASSTIRISMGRYTSEQDIDDAVDILVSCIEDLRAKKLVKDVSKTAIV
jgi:cysteine desulfurase